LKASYNNALNSKPWTNCLPGWLPCWVILPPHSTTHRAWLYTVMHTIRVIWPLWPTYISYWITLQVHLQCLISIQFNHVR